ncbi:hypothetical protein Pelo_4422, partial [Pelomyxa schiedti]
MGSNESSNQSARTPTKQPRPKATTAKSQVMAIVCAPTTTQKRGRCFVPSSAATPAQLAQPTTISAPTITTTTELAACVPQSMIQWIQSTTLFRAWAEDWVLRPGEEAVFRLPIWTYYLHVVVSPTLGLVSHSVFTHDGRVCG